MEVWLLLTEVFSIEASFFPADTLFGDGVWVLLLMEDILNRLVIFEEEFQKLNVIRRLDTTVVVK